MRYSIVALAPLVAAVYGRDSSSSSSTYTYSNTETNFLSMTNSYGVVTGMPTLSNPGTPVVNTDVGQANTNVGTLATIPAGLPSGINTVYIGGGNQSTRSFLVSVGSSTTAVIGGAIPTGASLTTGSGISAATAHASGSGSNSNSNSGATGTSEGGSTASQSASGSSSSSGADAVKVASGAVLGLGALFVALL